MSRKPSHAKRKPKGKKIAAIIVCAAAVALVALACAFQGDRIAAAAQNIAAQIEGRISSPGAADSSSHAGGTGDVVNDTARDGDDDDDGDANATVQTKQVASYDGIPIYSPVPASSITGVLFHQASYDYALVMDTELPKADSEQALAAQTIRVNNAQTDGTWLDADAVHVWRSSERNTMDTAVDVGAPAGTQEYAPVTGTVVLVAEYQLYNKCTDYELHIQPDGRPDLDFVLLHDTDLQVQAGDHVTAGVTPIASVRDIASSITGIQLAEYTGTDGNHAHMQINNADYEGYREKKLQGAIVPDQPQQQDQSPQADQSQTENAPGN